jgi:hypothetical protein
LFKGQTNLPEKVLEANILPFFSLMHTALTWSLVAIVRNCFVVGIGVNYGPQLVYEAG